MEFNLIQYILMTLILFGWCSFQLGKAMASTWQSITLMFFYTLLLTCFDRFLLFALFEQKLFSLIQFSVDFITLSIISLIAFKITRVNYMVAQYPWKYNKSSLFSYTEKK
jgi:hypothetical protein